MKGHICAKPKMMDKRRITFSLLDEANGREIICQTHGDNEAPSVLKKMEGMRHVELDGDWIDSFGGPPMVFRVTGIKPLDNSDKN